MQVDNKDTYRLIDYYATRRMRGLMTPYEADCNIQSEMYKWATCHCLYPVKVNYVNHFTGVPESRYVACGKCDHCRNAKSNELVTRILLDSKLQGHLYFVTLTYTSVYYDKGKFIGLQNLGKYNMPDWQPYEINDKVMAVLSKNILHYDNHNFRKKFNYTTCLLDMDDFSSFIKRLRTNTAAHIQYICFGEYGHKFGHPHMHCLISSNIPISDVEFKSAWSLYGCPIGSVDIVNLFASGKRSSVSATTKYVTKYVSKRDVSNRTRLRFAFQLPCGVSLTNNFPNYINPLILRNYEECINVLKNFNGFTIYREVDPENKVFFRDYVREHCESPRYSSRNTFGRLYYNSNSERFISGNLRLPQVGEKLVFPYWYQRQIQKQKYPITIYRVTRSGSSFYSKSSVPFVLRFIEKSFQGLDYDVSYPLSTVSFKFAATNIPFYLKYAGHFYDYSSHSHLILSGENYVGYRFSRKLKNYVPTGVIIPYSDFINKYIKQESDRYAEYMLSVESNYYQQQLYKLCMTDLVLEFENMRALEKSKWDNLRSKSLAKIVQNNYNEL